MEILYLSVLMQTGALIILLVVVFVAAQLISRKVRLPQTIQSSAIILAIEQTGVYMNNKPLVKLQMQVIPDKGRNFIAEVKEVLSSFDIKNLRNGSTVTVKYNVANVKEIALVKENY